MQIGVPVESDINEHRVAATPKTIKRFKDLGFEVLVQSGAGKKAGFKDEEYTARGATVVDGLSTLHEKSDIVIRVQPPTKEEAAKYRKGQLGIGFSEADRNEETLQIIADQGASYIAMDGIPRISRAQKMDALSSMANVSGYRAVIEGATQYGKFLNGQMTAAGKVDPAKVLVIGAGVAGLAAMATAKNMGAVVKAFDTRKSTEDQIRSLGAEVLTVDIQEDGSTAAGYSKVMSQAFIDAEMALFRSLAPDIDIVICTALVPMRPAPKLWLEDMVEKMKPGSVVVDLAYPRGGNCDLTVPGEVVKSDNGVTIVGVLDQMPKQSSELYSSNIAHLLDDMGGGEDFKIDTDDKVILGSLIVHDGEVNWPLPQISVAAPNVPKQKEEVKVPEVKKSKPVISKKTKRASTIWSAIIGGALLWLVGAYAPPEFMNHFTVFVLSIFIGWQVIWNVSHSLHTPLMSVTNAISGIILLGGILHVGTEFDLRTILAVIAVFVASINVVGGFLVTHKMLRMFHKEKEV
ncbi:MAG: Re/Si-specific NAD(P)(+) transhydrogenase subunit alpha [Saprospiraceae bacterium]|nr:Re/Si-specific NAD(P)(+) transhydrogenase subunit alpha [Saprospiraceae bacterium]